MRAYQRFGLLTLAAALAAPIATLEARQAPTRYEARRGPAYDMGYRAGLRVGEDHGRRGLSFNFSIADDYRRPERNWRREYGDRDDFRVTFRSGFEIGYREAFGRFAPVRGFAYGPGPVYRDRDGDRDDYYRGNGLPAVAGIAFNNGYRDGYQEGLNDGRHRHRNDPFAESRYRNGNHDYRFTYGSLEFYRSNYRPGFQSGYERGYADGWRF